MNWYKKAQLKTIDRTDISTSRQEYRDIAHDLYYRTENARIDNPNYMWVYNNGEIEAQPETMDQSSHRYYSQWDNVDYSVTYAGRYSPSTKTITIVRPIGPSQFREIPSHLKRLLQQKFPEAKKLSIHASTQRWYKKAQINDGAVKVRDDGSFYILGKNTKQDEGPWRISYLDSYQRGFGHIHFKTQEEAMKKFDELPGRIVSPELQEA